MSSSRSAALLRLGCRSTQLVGVGATPPTTTSTATHSGLLSSSSSSSSSSSTTSQYSQHASASWACSQGLNSSSSSGRGQHTSSRHEWTGVAAAAAAAAAAMSGAAGGADRAGVCDCETNTPSTSSASTSSTTTSSSRPWLRQLACSLVQPLAAAADVGPAPAQQPSWQQQQPQVGSGLEPLSGAIAALDEDGLTNHPLDYNPITNEHTAAMTLAKQAGIEAYQAGRYDEAERRFNEAISEARAGFPPGDPHIPSALHYLAELYRNTGQLDKAEPLYRETITCLADSLGERHWMYSAALCSLAALHEARGEYEQALQLLEEALELRRQLFSAGSFLYADTAALLAKTLMQQHNASADSSSKGGSSNSSGQRGGWLRGLWRGGRGSRAGGAAAVPPNVLRAISLWQQAISIVEDSGSVVDTPVVSWLLDLASAQQHAGQAAAAVGSLQKALEYMALPSHAQQVQVQQPQQEEVGGSGSTDAQADSSQQQQQQAMQLLAAGGSSSAATPSSSSSSQASVSSSGGSGSEDGGSEGEGDDTLSAVLAASGGDMALARHKLAALGSEAAERLVDAQLAAGDLPGARATLRAALEARMVLHGRHLVVAKTQTRLANLLMAPPPDPQAPQLAAHFAASAVAISEAALQTAQRANLWTRVLRNALTALSTAQLGSHRARAEAERSSQRLLAALQLGGASLALAAAERLNDRPDEAQAALRHAVSQLRWVLGVGAADLERLSSGGDVEPALLQRIAGLLVDLKLLQMDCLEALAAALAGGSSSSSSSATNSSTSSSSSSGGGSSAGGASADASAAPAARQGVVVVEVEGGDGDGDGGVPADEVLMLLGEAELLAAELYAD